MESNAKNVVIREFVLEAVQSALAKVAARKSMLAALTKNSRALEYASAELRADREIVLAARKAAGR